MTKYLQMDGVDDWLRTPTITFNKAIIDYFMDNPQPQSRYALLDTRTGYNGIFDSAYTTGGTYTTTDGKTYTSMSQFPIGVRRVVDVNLTNIGTDNANIFSWNDGTKNSKGKIYDVKFYNGITLVAHYEMSTGTVQDQSGNGNHASLTGGTWLDDGTGGTPTGTDGSTAFDSRQSIYSDLSIGADTTQRIYSDSFTRYDNKQALYADASNPFDIRNILYQDSLISSDTKQVIYQILSTSFDMLQELFNDGQVGQTPFDMRFVFYSDGSILHDSRQVMYEAGQNAYDLKQAIYESAENKGDMHLVLFADSSTHYDLIQSLYGDAAGHFDTRQTLFDTTKQVIGVIPLKGNRELYVYLAGRQQLSIPLKGKQDLFINLRGDVNVTIDNGLFKMYAGDSKYLPITIEGVTDFSGATAKWALMPSVYSTEHTLLKTIGGGISILDGKLQVKLDSIDTKSLTGKFYFETELTDALGNVSTVAVGEIEIKKSGV